MMTMYNYRRKDEEFNDLIEEIRAFAAAELEGSVIENKEERIANLNTGIVKYCVSGTRYESRFESEGTEIMKDPRVQKNSDVIENYNAVIAEIINPILPMVANKDFVRFLADVRQVGWGDTARFIVRSNELYKVNEIAEGVNRGILQPIHDQEITINARVIEIAAEVDFYAVAARVFDFADFGIRAARSFEQYIFLKVIAGFTAAIDEMGAAYQAAGFTTANWSTLAQRVSAANGGSEVFALGTLAALNQVYPAATGLQMGLGEEIAKKGYMDRFMGCRLVCLDQAFATPWGADTDGAFALADDMIYFVPVGADHPAKIVFEGDTLIAERDPDHTPDRTYRCRIQMHVGVGTVIGSRYGALDLIP